MGKMFTLISGILVVAVGFIVTASGFLPLVIAPMVLFVYGLYLLYMARR